MRDQQLDIYRALVMIYIVCVIHLEYWYEYIYEPLASLSLFEMPLIFYISGAAYSMKQDVPTFRNILKSRFMRILLPYYIYAFVSILIIIVLSPWMDCFDITQYTLRNFASILLFRYIEQMPYMWHLWFIIPYFVILLSLPLQLKAYRILKQKYLPVVFFIYALALLLPQDHYLILQLVTILGYNIFFVFGLSCYKKCHSARTHLLYGAIFSVLFVFLLQTKYDFVPMYWHKSSPDLVFITYGMIVTGLFYLICQHVKFKSNFIFRIWNKRGYTIYLYQNIVFFIVLPFKNYLTQNSSITLLNAALCSLAIFFISTLLSFITYPLEKKCIEQMKCIYKHLVQKPK